MQEKRYSITRIAKYEHFLYLLKWNVQQNYNLENSNRKKVPHSAIRFVWKYAHQQPELWYWISIQLSVFLVFLAVDRIVVVIVSQCQVDRIFNCNNARYPLDYLYCRLMTLSDNYLCATYTYRLCTLQPISDLCIAKWIRIENLFPMWSAVRGVYGHRSTMYDFKPFDGSIDNRRWRLFCTAAYAALVRGSLILCMCAIEFDCSAVAELQLHTATMTLAVPWAQRSTIICTHLWLCLCVMSVSEI